MGVGDFFQLSPVAKRGVPSERLFATRAWRGLFPAGPHQLATVWRQDGATSVQDLFRSALCNIRIGVCVESVLQFVEERTTLHTAESAVSLCQDSVVVVG